MEEEWIKWNNAKVMLAVVMAALVVQLCYSAIRMTQDNTYDPFQITVFATAALSVVLVGYVYYKGSCLLLGEKV